MTRPRQRFQASNSYTEAEVKVQREIINRALSGVSIPLSILRNKAFTSWARKVARLEDSIKRQKNGEALDDRGKPTMRVRHADGPVDVIIGKRPPVRVE